MRIVAEQDRHRCHEARRYRRLTRKPYRLNALPLVMIAVVLAGCGATESGPSSTAGPTLSTEAPAAAQLSPSEFATAVSEPNRVTINVHVPFEGDLADTDLSIPYDQIKQQAATLPPDRATPLAIYCRSGRMSAIAATTLKTLGYANIVELQGGMQAWEASGRTVVQR